jgi:hypothetical protein
VSVRLIKEVAAGRVAWQSGLAVEGWRARRPRPPGGAWAPVALWARLEIGAAKRLLKGRRLDVSAGRMLFALVANRTGAKLCHRPVN